MKNLSIIVAIAKNNAIGKDNDLLWRISDDLKRFKKYTTDNVIIMGKNIAIGDIDAVQETVKNTANNLKKMIPFGK